METINKSDLIPVLQNSELADQFEDEVTIPKEYIFDDYETIITYKIVIKDNESFYRIMNKLRYYMVKKLPYEIYDYVLEYRPDLSEFKDFFFEELKILLWERDGGVISSGCNLIDTCIYESKLNLVKYLREKKHSWTDTSCGNTVCKPFKTNRKEHFKLQLEMLKYLKKNGCTMSKNVCIRAAENGNYECLKYAHENGAELEVDNSFLRRHSYAGLNCCDTIILRYLKYNNFYETCSEQLKNQIFKEHLQCIKYINDNGCKWTVKGLNKAAEYGNLELLIFLHENGCAWNSQTFKAAGISASLECLKYLYKNECPWNSNTCSAVVLHDSTNKNITCEDRLNCLKYLHENECSWDSETCRNAAKTGNLPCLKYALENGCSINGFAIEGAASNGHLDCIKYIHETFNNYGQATLWDARACEYAANLECLKYLIENLCPHSISHCYNSAKERGDTEMMKYLKSLE